MQGVVTSAVSSRAGLPHTGLPYGYIYRRDAEISRDGRIQVTRAWWEIDSLGEDDKPLPWNRADVVTKMFNWIGNEGHTVYWVAKTLNEMGIKGPSGGIWSQDSVRYIMLNHCYTGKHKYNATTRVANPRETPWRYHRGDKEDSEKTQTGRRSC